MNRPKHPNPDIEKAVREAKAKGWRFVEAGGSSHAWGRLKCPERSREGCRMSVWSTPRDPKRHARQIVRNVNRCTHERA